MKRRAFLTGLGVTAVAVACGSNETGSAPTTIRSTPTRSHHPDHAEATLRQRFLEPAGPRRGDR